MPVYVSMNKISRTFETSHATDTRRLGELVGKALEKGCVIGLIGDLGAGKTCFTQGLAVGLGVPENEPVTSPSYTLVNEYRARLTLVHADLYRLGSEAELEDIGLYDLAQDTSVVVIEWADYASQNELNADLTIHITITDKNSRQIVFKAADPGMCSLHKALKH